ncbi:uncharacterized protein LOC114941472 [Nylanderia fulva]|uniref:uncharacterized protein LOC114941472 n=1 Tax=Nylanderia fulva TaxID=613905 RepID=UPI0010FB6DB8|nr:uncharacterized protein LOC114941472 [Nylanderia fulva]
MVKMSYPPLPNLVPIKPSNMCLNKVTKIALAEVLQSDPVKRLFNQPNIIIKTIPLKDIVSTTELDKNIFDNKRNGIQNATTLNNVKSPAMSIVPVKIPDEEKEDANLLPSKIEDKKSEISMLPVKKKLCGHYEPCESIVCDVMVQQYVDNDRVSPMLAVNIEEEEINALVGKHCKNQHCDALSIDHNRCRRALIKLHRCDRSRVCDICGITLEGSQTRIYHKNCTRKNEYRHNNVDRVHLLKERMRERELQILEIAKMKRNDYSDPVKAMETLRKNEEIIIIPKTTPSQQPIITITSIPSTQSIGTNVSNTQPIKINSENNFANLFRGVPFTISSQNTSRPIESKLQLINQVAFPNLQQKSYVTSTSTPTSVPSTSAPVTSLKNKFVRLTTCPSTQTTTIQPLSINNWVVSPSHVLTTTPIQSKSILTPIRVVPITNLITAPSLLHRTQGIPKFCIMAENVVTPVTIPQSLQPAITAAATTTNTVTTTITTSKATTSQQNDAQKVPIQQFSIQKLQNKGQKLLKKKKTFICDYCSKHFSTDWYFKMHVAKHKGEKLFFCDFCDESFSNKYDMNRHMAKQHDGQRKTFIRKDMCTRTLCCDKCDFTCKSFALFRTHAEIHMALSFDENDKLKQKLKSSEEKINHTSVHDLNGQNVKIIDCQDTSTDDDIEETEDNIESIVVKKHYKDLSMITYGNNISVKMNGFNFIDTIEKNIDPKNHKQESITS